MNDTNNSDNTTAATNSRSRKGLVIALIALIAVIALAAATYNILAPGVTPEMTTTAPADDSEKAPDFTMSSIDGEELALSDLRGKPVVLNFWASTCGPCQMEMPEFQSAYERYGDQINFVMLNVTGFNGETRERALRFIEQSGYTFPIYFEENESASMLYGITSIPRTYFITDSGDLEVYASGAIDGSTLAQGMDMILSES